MNLDQPRADEDYAAYHARLMLEGYPNASAMMIACDAFGLEMNDYSVVLWLNDPKANDSANSTRAMKLSSLRFPASMKCSSTTSRLPIPTFCEP